MIRLFLLPLVCAAAYSGPVAAQQLPPTPADYAKWESLGATTLSPNGRWIAYAISRPNDEG